MMKLYMKLIYLFMERVLNKNKMTTTLSNMNYSYGIGYDYNYPVLNDPKIKILSNLEDVYSRPVINEPKINVINSFESIMLETKLPTVLDLNEYYNLFLFNKVLTNVKFYNLALSKTINLKMLSNLEKLNKIKQSKDYNISNILIRRLESTLKQIETQPQIMPTYRKSVLLKFEHDEERSLTFEFFTFKLSYVIAPIKSKQSKIENYFSKENLRFSSELVTKIIEEFYGEQIGEFIK